MNLRICFKIINTTPSKFVCKRVEASKYEMEREEYKDIQRALKKIVSFEEKVAEEDVISITFNEYLDHMQEVTHE